MLAERDPGKDYANLGSSSPAGAHFIRSNIHFVCVPKQVSIRVKGLKGHKDG